jgi:hypothetical protein
LRSPYLTGDIALDAVLAEIDAKIADKAVMAGIRSGMSVIGKAIRSEIPIVHLRKTIGQKLKRLRNGKIIAKVGAGVGKKGDFRDMLGARKTNGKGVGISNRNIHWYLAGTKKRTTRRGANRGQMPKAPAVPKGYASSASAAMSAIRNRITIVLNREIQRATQQHKTKG